MDAAILKSGFSFWDRLTAGEQELLTSCSTFVRYPKGAPIHRSDERCAGLLLVRSGQIRAYILSEDGREVTLYRLFQGDTCVLSTSCVLNEVAFDVMIDAVEDTEAVLIPIGIFHQLMETNIYVELYSYKMATERFSDVMWSMQQILFMGVDRRLAIFLWDEMVKNGKDTVSYTHDQMARYIGSAREVVSRMLKYFSQEGIISQSRGSIQILDREKLRAYL